MKKILVVEDNYILNQDVCEFLREEGHLIKSVYCGKDAFDIIDRHEDMVALLTDVDLGPGPDGINVARYARAFSPRLPVVFMSANSNGRHELAGVAGSEFVAKPFRPQQIAKALSRVIQLQADSAPKAFRPLTANALSRASQWAA
ncbi:response regulator transcription factor [Phenylobacterium sp.]|uniref:response regulator transcription factor n=1 Tax=Phenylobacterium sp. TaxID=1871053 RepID=UPI0025CFB46C|nr:response regulator [Phenylobacterium sp.]